MKMKRTMMQQSLIVLLLTACSLSTFSQGKKNILILMADDFNHWAKSIGYYEQSYTPNIDRLAGKGVLFVDAHCSSPVCNPSRNAMMSGYRPSTTGISTNGGGFVRDKAGFEEIVTMNQYFKEQGYYVYGAGKIWHPGRMDYTNPDCDPAHWTDLNTNPSGCNGGSYSHFEATSEKFTEFVWGGNTSPMSETNCNDLGLANDVVDLLNGYKSSAFKDRPFFIACGFFRPHLPWNSPKEFWDLYGEDTLLIPKGYKENDLADINGAGTQDIFSELIEKDKWIEGIHAYLASISLADHNVGVVMNAVEENGYLDNTIIVFMGDHGWHLGEKNRWSKYAVYDQANHTTMIIYDPSAAGNGKVCHKVVSMQDIYPTLVELSGAEPRTSMEGRSLAPLLADPFDTNWDFPVLMTYGGTNIIKTNHYRFVDDGSSSQLYNVALDPYEFDNLYGKSGTDEIVAELKAKMDSMINIGMDLRAKLLEDYSFTPVVHAIPGLIEAEDYDEGVESQTYHDTDGLNDGGEYRKDGVDISITDDIRGGGFHVTSTKDGEWLQYSVAEYEKGIYKLTGRMKYSGAGSAKVHYYVNNEKVGDLLLTVANNEWTNYTIENITIDSEATLRFRVVMEGDDVEINSFQFTKVDQLIGIEFHDDGSDPLLRSNLINDNTLHLDLSGLNPIARLQVFSTKGECLEERMIPGEILLAYALKSTLKQGMYILRIDDGNQERVERFYIL